MTPTSIPATPVQPNEAFYGTDRLALFKTYTRETYRATFGVEAPAFDPARVMKNWFDSSVDTSQADNVALYNVAARGSDGNWGIHQFVIPAVEAGLVNLPGVIKYPAYVVPATHATRGDSAINPNYLCTKQQASDLAAEVGATGVSEEQLELFPVEYPPDEQRRIWNIIFRGNRIYAGLLLLNKYAKGVGSPGHWDTSKPEPVWISDPPAPDGLFDTRPPRPLPIRPLLANERFHVTLMGVQIQRTDMPEANATTFTEADRALLQQIARKVGAV